jgi:hypothetical protein
MNNCNILSTTQSTWCDATLFGGVILLSPVIMPMHAISDYRDQLKEKKHFRELELKINKNDLTAITTCVDDCVNFQVYMDKKNDLREQAITKLITWYGKKPQDHPEKLSPDVLSALVTAYTDNSWLQNVDSKTYTLKYDNLKQAEILLNALMIVKGTSMLSTENKDDWSLIFLSHVLQALPEKREVFWQQCASGSIIADSIGSYDKELICSHAYQDYQEKILKQPMSLYSPYEAIWEKGK